MAISPELKKIYAGDTTWLPLETLQFDHYLFSQPYYLVNDHQNWRFDIDETGNVVKLQEFTAMPFRLQLPNRDSGGTQELQIVMSNIGRILVDELERSNEDPTQNIGCTMRIFRNQMDSKPEITPPMKLFINSIVVQQDAVIATATRYDILNRPFPSRVFLANEFPGLQR